MSWRHIGIVAKLPVRETTGNHYSGLGNCDKFYFTFEFKVQMWVQNLPNIWEGMNTYSPFIELVKSEYR
jgi:hypothetical protein